MYTAEVHGIENWFESDITNYENGSVTALYHQVRILGYIRVSSRASLQVSYYLIYVYGGM